MNPAEPVLGAALAETLADDRAHQGVRPTADKTLLRGSDAYGCARKIAFGALNIPKAVPIPTDTLMAFDAGKHHHTRLQGILAQKFDAELEVPVSFKDQGIDVSGHADAVYTRLCEKEGEGDLLLKTVVEIKSMKAYPFLLAAGGTDRFGRDVNSGGPKLEHLIQAGIYAHGLGADTVHMVYINKEDGRIAEWFIDMDHEVIGPDSETLRQLVIAELNRLQAIAEDIKAGHLPWRRVPGHGLIKDPEASKDAGAFWGCAYCGWQPTCTALPVSKVPISRLTDDPQTETEEVWDAEVVG